MSRDDEQISAYLHGQMSPDELAAFAERLGRNAQLAQALARMSLVEVLLRDQLRFEAAPSLAGIAAPVVARREAASRWFRLPAALHRPLALALSSAAVVIGLLIAALAFIAIPQSLPHHALAPPQGEVVARLVNFDNPVWAVGQAATTRGAHLRSHQSLELRAGLATIEFNDGARVTIEGPTVLQLLSPSAARLDAGQLLAHVPPRAVGYQVHVGGLIVTDRGTRFNVQRAAGVADVDVFHGRVEIASTARGQDSPMLLRTGQMAKFSPRAELLEQGVSHKPIDTRKAELLDYRAQASGQIQFLAEPPPSLAEGALQSNTHAFLILERERVVLSQATAAQVPQPTGNGTAALATGTLPAGQRVDVYLIHMDIDETKLADTTQKITCRGVVHFEQPVLGVLPTSQRLAETDAEFGAPRTIYETDPARNASRGTELDNLDRLDRLSVSADGRTVSFAGVLGLPTTDQLRIFVQSAEP